ncbi:MAG: hypothetical protein R3F61_31380 [Myxococcota bacterium]
MSEVRHRILDLADDLEANGIDVAHLRPLQDELDLVQQPGVVRRLSRAAIDMARRQFELAALEARESRDMFAMVGRRARSLERFTPEEADLVRNQLADLLRLVPATILVATNQVLPVPGTSLLTPMLLRKLGLLPSRWRESHILWELQQQAETLHAAGRHRQAAKVEALQHQLEVEADARELAEQDAAVLTHWDTDANGVLDDEERARYEAECGRVRALAAENAHRRKWYLSTDGGVVGPVRLTALPPVGPVMVCYDGRTGWVPLAEIRPV